MARQARCNAPWYELNISAPDNRVTACCFYAGQTDVVSDDYQDIDGYWNSPAMVDLRKIQSGDSSVDASGCRQCFYFKYRGDSGDSYISDFQNPPEDLSDAQRANWQAAIDAFKAGDSHVASTPLRYYFNFGFACNISCIMCHQVPRRKTNKRQLAADLFLKWKPSMVSAREIWVIGGEPLLLPEAVKFIDSVLVDPDLADVQLVIYTNGTLIERHLDRLRKKRKLQLIVSLDAVGSAYEYIRHRGKWDTVERGILKFKEAGARHGLNWSVLTANIVMKSSIPALGALVDWSIKHDITPSFMDFINAEGLELNFRQESVTTYPELLDEIPGWRDEFSGAIGKLKARGWVSAAGVLSNILETLATKYDANSIKRSELARIRSQGAWSSVYAGNSSQLYSLLQVNHYGKMRGQKPLVLKEDGMVWSPTDGKDHLATPYFKASRKDVSGTRWIRILSEWPADSEPDACLLTVQDTQFNTLPIAGSYRTANGQVTTETCLELPEKATGFRLVWTPAALGTTLVPRTVRVEQCIEARAEIVNA